MAQLDRLQSQAIDYFQALLEGQEQLSLEQTGAVTKLLSELRRNEAAIQKDLPQREEDPTELYEAMALDKRRRSFAHALRYAVAYPDRAIRRADAIWRGESPSPPTSPDESDAK